jgi:hypothetical protein
MPFKKMKKPIDGDNPIGKQERNQTMHLFG